MAPLKIAHRGYGGKDNTKEAFENALKNGFDVLEVDLHKTLDDKIVLHHDLFIEDVNIEHNTLEFLQTKYPDLLSLEELFYYFPPDTNRIYLDLKGCDELAQILILFMIENGYHCRNILVASFNRYHVQILGYSFLDWSVGFITYNTFLLFEYDVLVNNIDFIVMDWTTLSFGTIEYLMTNSKDIYVCTVSSEKIYKHIYPYIEKNLIKGIVSDILLI